VETIPVTAVVPVKNEEKNLPRCLERLRDFAEVVVVDSGSTDATRSIAREHGATLLDFAWNGTFPKKRNWCLRNHAFTTEWVLFVDADERVTDELKAELRRVLPGTRHAGFLLTYRNHFLGRRLKHGDRFRKLSLFRVGSGEYERIEEDRWSSLDMEVHEHPILTGSVGRLRAPIIHEDFRPLEAYIARHNEYSSWEARRYWALKRTPDAAGRLTRRQRLKYRLLSSWLGGPAYFLATYVLKLGFLDGLPGFIFAALKMTYFFQARCKIHEARPVVPGGRGAAPHESPRCGQPRRRRISRQPGPAANR